MPTGKGGAGTLCGNLFPFRSFAVTISSLVLLSSTNVAYSQLQEGSNHLLEEWVKTTVQTSFGGEAKQLAAYRKLAASRKLQQDDREVDEFVTTVLTEEIKGRLTEGILTRLRAGDEESIFEFENDACKLYDLFPPLTPCNCTRT